MTDPDPVDEVLARSRRALDQHMHAVRGAKSSSQGSPTEQTTTHHHQDRSQAETVSLDHLAMFGIDPSDPAPSVTLVATPGGLNPDVDMDIGGCASHEVDKASAKLVRVERALELANRRRRTVEADNQELRKQVAALTAQRDEAVARASELEAGAAACDAPDVRLDAEAEVNGTVEDPRGLPPEWEVATSRTTGRRYYVNQTTGESQWEHPGFEAGFKPEATLGLALEAVSKDGKSSILLPRGAKHVALCKGQNGFGINIRSDAMVLEYHPQGVVASPEVAAVRVGWFLAAAAGIATHSREDVLEVLRSVPVHPFAACWR
jgi:hypothetical protein